MSQFSGKFAPKRYPLHLSKMQGVLINEVSFLKKISNIRQNLKKKVGLSRATFDSQVIVLHFDLTGLPSKSIQWVNNSTLLKS